MDAPAGPGGGRSWLFIKVLGAVAVGTLLTELVYYVLKKLDQRSAKGAVQGSAKRTMKALFFRGPTSSTAQQPVSVSTMVACKDQFTRRHGCTNTRCGFSHDPDTAYAQLLSVLHSPHTQIDVCVFVFTCTDLADVLLDLHERGVVVRVITDGEQLEASGSQISRLRADGVQVRHNKTSYHMHHKFALIDCRWLLNGSFNWTRQAITGNNENLLLTDNASLVSAYQAEFDTLWEEFSPENRL